MDSSAHIEDLAAFVSASPSSFHAAAEVARRLTAAGYSPLDETADWREAVRPGGRFVVVRDGSVIGITIPAGAGATTPYRIMGAHTDSPGFKLKPRPSASVNGWLEAGVEVYGGPILSSWFDRELEFAGRLVDLDGTTHLVRTGPFARIPHLAIHLDRELNNGFAPDKQRDMQPIFGVGGPAAADVVGHLAGLAGIDSAAVAGYDIITVDSAAPARFGLDRSLFASARLDNLSSVHAGLVALTSAAEGPAIAVLAAFDHEEVGSESRSGAAGPFLADILERVTGALGGHEQDRREQSRPDGQPSGRSGGGGGGGNDGGSGSGGNDGGSGGRNGGSGGNGGGSGNGRGGWNGSGGREDLARSIARSWCLSADAGHAVHPNRGEKHDPLNRPVAGGGPLLKINANQRYTTDAVGAALWARTCGRAGVPYQEFVSNNAVPCGSTIGPITSTRIGIPTLDVGTPLLSMHSARELCHVDDPGRLAAATRVFFEGEV